MDHVNIKSEVNEALRRAKGKVDDAVNWGDLRCFDVIKADGRYVVFIAEASPDAWQLQNFVREYLQEKGYHDVEVVTEW